MSSTPSDQTPEINEDQVLDILNGVGENPAPTANPPVPDYAIIGATRPRVPWNGAMETVQPRVPRRPLLAQDVAGPETLRQPPNLYDPMGEVTRYARDRERLRQGAFIPPRQSDPDPTVPDLRETPPLSPADQEAIAEAERRRLEAEVMAEAQSISRLLRERAELRDRRRRFAAPYGRTTENNADRAIGERAIEEAARLLQQQQLQDRERIDAVMLQSLRVEAIRPIYNFAVGLRDAGYVTMDDDELSWAYTDHALRNRHDCAYTIRVEGHAELVIRPQRVTEAVHDSVTHSIVYSFELFCNSHSPVINGTRNSLRSMLREVLEQLVIVRPWESIRELFTTTGGMESITANRPAADAPQAGAVPDNFRAITIR